MSAWSDCVRHMHVVLMEYHDAQAWAWVEVRLELKVGSSVRPTDVQLGLYCEGEEVAVGFCDSQGKWRVRVDDLKRPPEELIFEAHARIPLKRAQSERKQIYRVRSDGRLHLESENLLPSAPTPDPQLQFVLPEMVKIRTGTYWMGRHAHAHRVRISRPLVVSTTPITQQLYEMVMKTNPSHFKNPRRPVEQVSFWESLEFCNRLSVLENLPEAYRIYIEQGRKSVEWLRSSSGYRLLTEAEWEYCAKAGKENLFSGSSHLDEVGWYQKNAKGRTQIVGQKKANGWGLYDLSGNVWEWCFDEWSETAYDRRKGELNTDPLVQSSHSATRRVRRGGCWLTFHTSCSVHHRFWASTNQQADDTGFRIARTL